MIQGSSPSRGRDFSLLQNAQTSSGANPASQCVPEFSAKGKGARREVDHSPTFTKLC